MAIAGVSAVGDLFRTVLGGQDLVKSLTDKGPGADFYTVRLEVGNNQDAAGNPPSVILTDFSNTQFFGVFEGTSKVPNDMCRNNQDLPIGDFDAKDQKLFKGLKNGEAPIRAFKTANGFNLKSVDFQAGSNAICISNLIFKGSDTQARRDEIFIPIGDLGFLCGKEWNWGTIFKGSQQRCLWLDGKPDNGNKPMESLHLDMEKIALFFNVGQEEELKKLDKATACGLFSDSTSQIPNRNDCKPNKKRDISSKNITIDTVPLIEIKSQDITSSKVSVKGFVGSGFVTSDNKFFDSETQKLIEVTPTAGKLKSRNFAKKIRADRTNLQIAEEEFKMIQKRESLSNVMKVQTCTATKDGNSPDCKLDEMVTIPISRKK